MYLYSLSDLKVSCFSFHFLFFFTFNFCPEDKCYYFLRDVVPHNINQISHYKNENDFHVVPLQIISETSSI